MPDHLDYTRPIFSAGQDLRTSRFQKTPPAPAGLWDRPTYLCPELGRTCRRPNAYDAFELPSLMGKECVPYRGRNDG